MEEEEEHSAVMLIEFIVDSDNKICCRILAQTWLFIKDAITIACSAYQSAVMYRPDYAVNGFKAP
ncbi:hypothetical protein L914_12140 [Phytophthora nicotianae]|uniref:Uncharacterized protein n=3 Tax=Phytophthora nicotianae TaxID=4792 RepID=W2N0U5_PHYNI|nr:hypothetical protein L914_12140 [Phytophthora nicotianae]